jgi:para-nitrobenzyl esterase
MLRGVEVLRRVLVRRRVATRDVPARQALAKVNPLPTDLQAIDAGATGSLHVTDRSLFDVLARDAEIDVVRRGHAGKLTRNTLPFVVIAQTKSGSVRGFVRDGVRTWLGVPYAAPPTGALRFRPPEPAPAWTGELDATHVGAVAMQERNSVMAGLTDKTRIAEDCLTLNISAPPHGDNHPVMVWIHGGAFVMGSGGVPLYDGITFASRHDIVVVTINYRLGLFGFLLTDQRDQGNCGLLDQIAALRWVRDNIAAFGGDPSSVTVMGESAGAISIANLLAMPAARGLFHRAILQSGAGALVPPSRADAEQVAAQVVAELGSPAAAPADKILAVQALLMRQRGLTAIAPYVDGVNIVTGPRQAALAGTIAAVPLLMGTNRDEWALFDALLPGTAKIVEAQIRARIGDAAPDAMIAGYRVPSELAGDVSFRIPAVRLAEAHPAPVYFYRCDVGGRMLGAAHAVELPLVWNHLANPFAQFLLGGDTKPFEPIALAMHDTWASFIRTGEPNGAGLPEWPRYDAERRATMIIDRDASRVESDAGGAQRIAWAKLLADGGI